MSFASDAAICRDVLDRQLPRLATLTVRGNDLLGAYEDTGLAKVVVRYVGAALDAALDTCGA